MSNQIEQIRAEIERRNLANYCGTAEQYEEELLAILDTIEAEEKEHPISADAQEAEIRRINITPSELRYVIDAIPSSAGIFSTEDDAKKGLAIFKAGAQYERDRLMKEAPVAEVREMRGNTDTEYPFVLTLGFPRIPNIEYHGGKVRVIIEEIKQQPLNNKSL